MTLQTAILTGALLSALSLSAQTNAPDPLVVWMNRIAQEQLDEREKEIAAIRTTADAERRKKIVRQKILDAIGGLPDYSGPLNARVTGKIEAEGYVIEKVVYESLPGFYVTANLYRPARPGRYPGVLLQAGHTQEGKAEPQLLAANLALKGFVALAFDPAGQGERVQTYDSQTKRPAAGWSVTEHINAGAQARMVDDGLARYFIWDAKRSIDYLASRPEVDASRLGAAGCSGGGALTTFIGGLDSRLKAVIPSCFPNSYRLLFNVEAQDGEMAVPQEVFRGLDTADFVELSAPGAAWQIHATERDYFTPEGARMVYEEARRWYRLYGAEEKIDFFVGPGPHGTPLVSREAMYKWLIRWLKDGQGDYREKWVKLYPNHELLATKTGRVDDEPGSRKLYQLILERYRAKKQPRGTAALAAELKRLKIASGPTAPPVKVVKESQEDGFRQQHLVIESEPGIELDAQLYLPPTAGRKPAVLLLPGRLSSFVAARIAKSGRVVLLLTPRRSTLRRETHPFQGDWSSNARADIIGENLPAMRARDILRGVDLLCAREDVDAASIRAGAQGLHGIWLLLAAAADARIGKLWIDRTPHSLEAALQDALTNGLPEVTIPGFVLHWDLGDLVRLMGNRPVLWTDPTNWMGHVVPAGPQFRYRWVIGDLTENRNTQDLEFLEEMLK